MNFAELEGVWGVRGLIAVKRVDSSLLYRSSRLDPADCAAIAGSIRSVVKSAPSAVTRITVTLDDGSLMVISSGEALLALHLANQFDGVGLRELLSDMVPARQDSSLPASEADITQLTSAMEAVTRPVIEELGLFVAVNTLRNARGRVLSRHRSLGAFNVEKGGGITLRAAPACSRGEAVAAVAAWAAAFYQHCHQIVPAFPPELVISLLEPMRAKLEEIGFFEAWRRAVPGS